MFLMLYSVLVDIPWPCLLDEVYPWPGGRSSKGEHWPTLGVPQPARGILIDSKYQPPILTKVGYYYVPIITMLPIMLHITMFQVKCLF